LVWIGVALSIVVLAIAAISNVGSKLDEPLSGSAPPQPSNPSPTPRTIDEVLDALNRGNIAFNTPELARLGKQINVEAKISANLTPQELKALINEAGKVEVATLKISGHMYAALDGGTAFDVSPTGRQEQWVSSKEPTSWIWQVTPKTQGNQSVVLEVGVLISINGVPGSRSLQTYKRTINVDVAWPQTISEWLKFAKETLENISSIWAVIAAVAAAGGGLFVKYLKRRSAKLPKKPKSDPGSR
jgi:hypothetical protein